MKRHTDRPMGEDLIYTATEELCPDCGKVLPVCHSFARPVEGLDKRFRLVRRDKRCGPACCGQRPLFLAPKDLRIVLPQRIYGFDVTLLVGERHLTDGFSLNQVTRDLNGRGLPVDQRHTGRIFRDFLTLASLARGSEAQIQERLRAQGGIVLMCDGVQFDDRSPVLYLLWDAVSGTPLFGERKLFRGKDDLRPLLEQVRAMQVPVLGIVTDKEKGLVPAVSAVFPNTPYQFCHTHYLKNCAKPLQPDLHRLGGSVAHRAERVRALEKELSTPSMPVDPPPEPRAPGTSPPAGEASPASLTLPNGAPASASSNEAMASGPLTEEELTRTLCELVRANRHVSGKAPLAPPELARHQRLEDIRTLVNDARKKKARRARTLETGPCSADSTGRLH